MRKFIFILLFSLSAMALAGCRPEMDFVEGSLRPGQAEVSLSGGNLSVLFTSAAGSISVDLEANRKWTAEFVNDRAKDWCTLSTNSGKSGVATITVSVKANEDYDQRSASINFVCDDVRRTIVVTQKQKDALVLTSDRVEVSHEGGRFTVELKANVPFEYSIAEDAKSWLKYVGTKGLTTSTLTFLADALDEVGKREGAITFKSSVGTETVHVYQEGLDPEMIVSSNYVEVPSTSASFRVEVRSNVDVTVEIPKSCDWIREVKSKALSTNTFFFSVDRNDGRAKREASLVFKNAEHGLSENVVVSQAFQPILATRDTVLASARGCRVSFSTAGGNPDDYRVEPAVSWISRAGHDGNQFFLDIQKRTGNDDSDRHAAVLVYYQDYDIPDTLNVLQFPKLPYFSYTSASRTVVVPEIYSRDLNQVGLVSWEEGLVERWEPGLSHTYPTSGPHTILVEIRNKNRVSFSRLENGMTINLSDLRKDEEE